MVQELDRCRKVAIHEPDHIGFHAFVSPTERQHREVIIDWMVGIISNECHHLKQHLL